MNLFTPKRSSLISFAVLVLLSVAFVFLAKPLDLNLLKDSNSPDWFMTGVSVSQFDDQGNLTGKLENSPLAIHHPINNTISLQSPFITMIDDNKTPWHINADHGLVYQNSPDKINLWDNVVLKQLDGPNSDHTTVLTSQMMYHPKSAFAHTDRAFVMEQPGTVVHSIGFNAWLKKSLIKFSHQSETEMTNN